METTLQFPDFLLSTEMYVFVSEWLPNDNRYCNRYASAGLWPGISGLDRGDVAFL